MSSNEHSESENELEAIIAEESAKQKSVEAIENSNKRSQPLLEVSETATPSKIKRTKKLSTETEWVKSDYEKYLEKLVFGDKPTLLENLKEAAGERVADRDDESKPKRQPVWQDADDEEFQVGDVMRENKWTGSLAHLDKDKKYSELLKSKFNRLQAPPKWADLDRERDDVDSDEEELLKSVGHLAPRSKSVSLPTNNVQYKRLKDLNRATYAEGSITTVQFHPTSTVALVAGLSGIATIYAIDGRKNDKLHNVKFQGFPVKCGRLLSNGLEAILGSKKNYFYSYDMMQGEANRVFLPKIMTKLNRFEVSPCCKYLAACGRFGEVFLLDCRSKELLHTFKQENPCTALQFTDDSKKLICHSTGSDVTVFDLRQERVEHVFTDDGCISGKTVVLSPNQRMLATGSNEGVVNVYNYDKVMLSRNPKPDKVIYNLTTSISDTKFNHSSEILAICSESIRGAAKLVHFPSGTVFANFPEFQTTIGAIRTVNFSPGSGYLATGNIVKQVPLFRLKHFSNY